MKLPLIWALRELRGGLRGFRIFLACLALGVGAIACVGSIAASIEAGLTTNAKAMLGGDVELHLVHRTATADELAFLEASGTVSRVAEMRAMARSEDGQQVSLIELRGIDEIYPLFGAVGLDPPGNLRFFLSRSDEKSDKNGVDTSFGAVAAPDLIARLGLKPGDRFRVGDARFILNAALTAEPDAASGSFALGPHVMIAAAALEATGLVQPGTLIDYSYRVRFKPGIDRARWLETLRATFPDAGWRIREPGEAAPNLTRLLDRVSLFLTLVGLMALLVGGVGVANAVRAYLGGKLATIATLKSLGAPRATIFATYLTQILILAAGGIVLGLAAGALIPIVALPYLPEALAPRRLGIYPAPLALAALYGLLVTLVFSLWPIAAACETQAASLFRAAIEPPSVPPPRLYRLATILVAALLAALVIGSANDRAIAAWFIVGAILSLAAFRGLALLLMLVARRFHPRAAMPRLALANLYRRGAPTPAIITSLGLGLAVLVAIALIEANLGRLIDEDLPERAPSFFFLDLQPDQKPAFDKLLATTPGVSESDAMPSLRGRIVKLNGVPAEHAKVSGDARWTLQSERGLTYSSTLPRGSRIVAGQWWQDYSGPPLVSMDAGIARGLGLRLGDTVTVDVLGREMTARLASLRAIDWGSLGINFVMIFSPGSLDGVPQTYIVTARATPGAELTLERAVAAQFPSVSAIPVRDVLAQLGAVVAAIAIALRATAALALIAGILVLAGAVAAGRRRRIYEAVLLKVLGATRSALTRLFLIEFAVLGFATALIALGIGTLAAYFVLEDGMGAGFVFAPGVALATAILGVIVTSLIGYAGTWNALGARPARYLANE